MGLTSNQAAQLLDIAGGSLRQIETNVKPASLALAYRAERLYGVPVGDLLIDDENQPTPEPKREPAEPKVEPVAPPRRRNGNSDRRGPRRNAAGAAA
jgi:transcriptional regulator with XRE-family HTH domain